jgi:DNA-directed RNA polymerase subunit H (RpoH/RPB5)
MHILQPKHSKLGEKESEKILSDLNISKAQLPKILSTDSALPEGCVVGDIIKIEREELEIPNSSSSTQSAERKNDKVNIYFRVVV